MRSIGLACVLLACAPAMHGTRDPRPNAASNAPAMASSRPAQTPERTPAAQPAEGTAAAAPERHGCPVEMQEPELVLARVGDRTITACDLALEQIHRSRVGLPDATPQALFETVLRETLVVSEQPADVRDEAIDRVLEDALLRDEALRAVAHDLPDDARIERFYREHTDDFVRAERIRLRQLVFASERAAHEALRALSAGTPFDDLLAHSVDPNAGRDAGDLGWVTRETDDVPAALVSAGFSLVNVGDVSARPVVVTARVTVRRRTRTLSRWHLLELVDREPAVQLSLPEVRRRIVHRLTRDRYLSQRREAAARWRESLGAQVHDAVDPHAFAAVRLSPTAPVARP